ncbi:MAG: TatD family hydrolase [Bacteroidales bacterium]|nr:TatD family hydrolase [Bacteroidales bacterium]
MKLFNFHTHNKSENYGIINIYPEENILFGKKYSCGLHPWHYSENYETALSQIELLAKEEKIVAVGETGFDPKSPVNIDMQSKIFVKHVEISEKYNLPLIIHCVKYYNELIKIKSQLKPQNIWILHGFNGKIDIAKKLVEQGFYFSISENILKDTKKAGSLLEIIPTDTIFFETDDKNYNIETIYKFVAENYSMTLSDLVKYIEINLKIMGI